MKTRHWLPRSIRVVSILTVRIVYILAGVNRITSISMFAQELRRLRQYAKLTQEQVANKARVSREYVSMLESGKNVPTIDVFIRLCRAVGASPAEVITKLERVRK